MSTPVIQQAHEVAVVFAHAGVALENRLRTIGAEHAQKGLLKSGATVRRFGEAFEIEARGAMIELAPLQKAAARSPILRTKLAEAVEQGFQGLQDLTEGRLGRLGLSEKSMTDHIQERRAGLSKDASPALMKRRPLPTWMVKAGLASAKGAFRWSAGVAAAVLAGYILFRMGWL